jgi:antitoxin MazE
MEADMQVSKWGNSLAVRLSKKLVDELQLKAGDELSIIAASKRQIAVEKTDARAEFLRQMEAFRFTLPDGYKFDRDEANER